MQEVWRRADSERRAEPLDLATDARGRTGRWESDEQTRLMVCNRIFCLVNDLRRWFIDGLLRAEIA